MNSARRPASLEPVEVSVMLSLEALAKTYHDASALCVFLYALIPFWSLLSLIMYCSFCPNPSNQLDLFTLSAVLEAFVSH